MVVRDGTQRAADARMLEEQGEARHHQPGDHRGGDIDLLEDHAAAQDIPLVGAGRQPELLGDHHLGLAAEDQLAEADQEVGEPDRRHEQDQVGLVDQRPQHAALDRDGQRQHDQHARGQGQEGRHAGRVQADQGQGGEHHHDPLGEVEDAGSLEDQDEAEGDQGVEDARDQAFPDHLEEEVGHSRHLDERIDEDRVGQLHRVARYCAAPR